MTVACCRVFRVEIVECVAETETVSAYFIGIGGTYALACGADFSASFSLLVCCVEQTVSGHDKVDFL